MAKVIFGALLITIISCTVLSTQPQGLKCGKGKACLIMPTPPF